MPKRDDDLLIGDILDCCQKIFTYTKDISLVEFINSSMTIDAVVRNLKSLAKPQI